MMKKRMLGLMMAFVVTAEAATIPASSYIQKDLVANWDAIENGGAGVHGDVATSGWTDIVGGCVLTTNVTADGCATTTETSVHLVKTSLRAHDEGGFVTGLANLVGSAEHTVEIAARDTSNGFDQKPWLAIKNADVGEWSNCILQWFNQNGVLAYVLHYSSASKGGFNGTNPVNTDFTRSLKTSDCRNYTSYNNGALVKSVDLGEGSKTIVSTKGAITLNANYYTEKPWTGSTPDYHAVRIYSRALTADEIKWNRVVDRIRFESADPAAVLPTGYRISDNAVELHLAATATRGGSVSVDGAEGVSAWDVWCTPRQEASVTVKAVAAPRYAFTGWTGDVDGLDATAAELTLTDDRPRTLQANFQATESLVEIGRFQQRYPWNGLVDIDYFVDGVTATQAETLWLEFSVTAGTGESVKKVVASNFTNAVWCDLPVTNGSYHIVWDSAADGVTLQALNGTAKARLYSRTVAEKDATYAIVDVSAGKNATRYPIRYVDGGENLSACFNCDEYLLNKMVLKRVKAGEFWMGVGNVESGTARHRVRLTEDYFCGLFPVSRKQFECLTGASHNQGRADRNPVESLSWNHIHYGYSASEPSALPMLNQKVQVGGGTTLADGFRLPTEAEWEYVCRAGTETKWYFGNTKPSDWSTKWAQMTGTSSATLGQREPNPWGFYDFYGNAGEWCEDWSEATVEYGSTVDYPVYSAVEVTENPLKTTGERRVIRGLPSNNNLSSGYRWTFTPERTNYANLGQGYFGFRVVRTVGTTVAETEESAVTEAERMVSLDLTEAAVRKLLDISELLPFVYNTADGWARGGDADVSATLAYAQMAGDRDADPSEWTAGDAQTLLTAAGEGAYVWTPPVRGLYKVTLTVGEYALTAYYDLLDAVVPVTPGEPLVFDTAEAATNAMAAAVVAPSAEVAAALGSDAAIATYCDMFGFDVVPTSGGQWAVVAGLKPEAWSNVVESAQAATLQIPVAELAAWQSGDDPIRVPLTNCVPGFYYSLYDGAAVTNLKADIREKNCNVLCDAEKTAVLLEVTPPAACTTSGFFTLGVLETPSVIPGETETYTNIPHRKPTFPIPPGW